MRLTQQEMRRLLPRDVHHRETFLFLSFVKMIELSEGTLDKINSLFSSHERKEAGEFLKIECGENIPFCEHHDKYDMERIRFAALKLSEGNIEKLVEAIELAQIDWRDLFMAAGFGHDVEAHNKWNP